MVDRWGGSWGTSWGGSTGTTSDTPTVRPEVWWPVRRNRRDVRRQLEDEEYERRLREQAAELLEEAVEDERTNALLARGKSLRELLLTAPILDEPRPPSISSAELARMLADIQRDAVAILKRIKDDEDDEDAAATLLLM